MNARDTAAGGADPDDRGLSRRGMLGAAGGAFLAKWIAGSPAHAGPAGTSGTRGGDMIALDEATNIAVAPSPDGRTILFDLLGLLWTMPGDGGVARCLTDAFADAAYPCWSPDGAKIAFQSYRSGNFQIWIANADGSEARQITSGASDCREPCFSPDGAAILFSSDRDGSYAIHRVDIANGAIRRLSEGPGQHSEPCMSRDGKRLAYVRDDRELVVIDSEGSTRRVAAVAKPKGWMTPSELRAPCFAPDGTLTFVTISDGTSAIRTPDQPLVEMADIYPFRSGWLPGGELLFAAAGAIRRRTRSGAEQMLRFSAPVAVTRADYRRRPRDSSPRRSVPARGIASPALSPDGRQIAFGALGDIHLLTIGNAAPRRLTRHPGNKTYPAWSPDGGHLAYSDDRSGVPNLWLHDLATGSERQLTNLPGGAAATLPFWSADGTRIGFQDHRGALHVVECETGAVRQVYDALWQPGRGSFSPDGSRIALAAFKPSSPRYREGLSEVLVVDVAAGKGRYTPIGPGRSIATRGDDGPAWSPDGRYLAYIFASTLWVQPVDADGEFDGSARQLTDEVSDCPSWSGDSETILYLSAGRLRTVDLHDRTVSTVPLRLIWASATAPKRQRIEGARLWDGLSPEYRDADLLLEGNRIAAVAERGRLAQGDGPAIDARGLTLLPGLIDMHTHRHVHGAAYGDRMGHLLLSLGITSTRSVGGAAYHGVEDREAIEAGLRSGPRHFTTGEALDGGRIYYNFMRPVTEAGQLDLEFERAEALGYDIVKTYVRLDHRTQADVIARAHAMGVPVTSHYHYPALREGADGTEHLGATNRLGFSRTATAFGAGYSDVNALFAAARAGRTPTLFLANALLPENPDLVLDSRVRTLLPRWDLERLDGLKRMMDASDRTILLAALERQVAQIRSTMDHGWHVHSGTDAPIDTIGVSLHMNLRAMVRFGLSPHDALASATRHAGAALDAPLGTIAPGQLADLLFVEGDPLSDIRAAAATRMVVTNGRMVDLGGLVARYREKETPAPFPDVRTLAASDPYYWHRPAYVAQSRATCCAGHRLPLA